MVWARGVVAGSARVEEHEILVDVRRAVDVHMRREGKEEAGGTANVLVRGFERCVNIRAKDLTTLRQSDEQGGASVSEGVMIKAIHR